MTQPNLSARLVEFSIGTFPKVDHEKTLCDVYNNLFFVCGFKVPRLSPGEKKKVTVTVENIQKPISQRKL